MVIRNKSKLFDGIDGWLLHVWNHGIHTL